MSCGRPAPWRCWAEWADVQDGLFAQAPEQRVAALQTVGVWRCRGRLPLSVDVTASLVETMAGDTGAQPCVAIGLSETQLRLQYAMAVVRLVNGISDSSQRGRVAASVASLAVDAGLPRLLVDVRHEATHNELPSLALLRLAAQRALGWLRAAYWGRQAQALAASQGRVTALLQELCGQQQPVAARAAGSPDPGPPGQAGEAWKQRRRAAELELRELVPKCAPDLLAASILDHGAVPCPGRDAPGREPLLAPLAELYPGLQPAVLAAAVRCLTTGRPAAEPPIPPPGNGVREARAQACLAWAEHLLGPAPGQPGGKRKAGAAAPQAGGWQCPPAQLQALLAACLQAPPPTASSDHRQVRSDALAGLLRAALARAAPGKPPAEQPAPADPAAGGRAGGGLQAAQQGAEAEMAAQLAFLSQARQRRRRAEGAPAPSGRWQLAERWQPCAIGNLPSVHCAAGTASNLQGVAIELLR